MKINGLGEVFNKAHDPEKLYVWYERNLGLQRDQEGGFDILSEHLVPVDTSYFSPSPSPGQVNFQVENLAETLTSLADNGVRIEDHLTENEQGRFAWVFDAEGNKIELWEPRPYWYSPIDLPEAE